MSKTIEYLGKLFYHSYLTPAGPFFTEKDYPDLTNQKWLVTGATGGIGLEVSRILLKQNVELWIAGRSEEKLKNAHSALLSEFPNSKIHIVKIDYNDLETVKPGLESLKKETKELHGIIHNAGVMFVPPNAVTKQGYEQTIGVNNLATQLVQDLLDPLIENTPNGRIVWLSSIAHVYAPRNGFDVDVIANGTTAKRYSLSKALDYIMAVQWSMKHPSSKVKSVAVHPGIIKSDLARHMTPYKRKLFEMFQWETEYGARTVVSAALNPNVANNEYVVPFGRPGYMRPDILRAANNEKGAAAVEYLESKITPFK